MSDCIKRQREVRKGEEQFRCINREAETYRELVVLEQCDACPVKRLLRQPPDERPQSSGCGTCGSAPRYINLEAEGWPPCHFREFSDGRPPICSVTGLEVTHEICDRCDEQAREHTASLGDKVVNYPMAIRKWVASGRPTRTDEEVEQIFSEHCNQCDRFDKEKQACKACGCSIGLGKNPLTNKLKMATEACPLGRF